MGLVHGDVQTGCKHREGGGGDREATRPRLVAMLLTVIKHLPTLSSGSQYSPDNNSVSW